MRRSRARLSPAVVNVYAAKTVVTRNPLFEDPLFRRFFGGPGGPGGPQVQRSLGSGVIVDAGGLVVTNNHVIEGASEIKVSLADKREFDAEVVLKDPRSDLAVLQLLEVKERFPAIDIGDSDALQVGDVVLAIGNPFGVGQTVTHGIVSAVARTQVGITDYQFFIQTDAAINPGNSGGALVDLAGRLIGVNTAIFSRSGGSQGIGFAVPVNMVRVVMASAKSGGGVGAAAMARRQAAGAHARDRGKSRAEASGRRAGRQRGRQTVRRRARAFETGDVIVSIDNQAVDDPNAFDYRFATRPLGGQAQLGVIRAGKETKLAVALQSAPDTPRDEITIQSRSPFLGMTVSNVSPALADELRLDPSASGVVITEIADGSVAQSLRISEG